MQNWPISSTWSRNIFAIAIVLVATIVRFAFLGILENRVAFITFYPAVMIAALYSGLSGGILATLLSAAIASYFWMQPIGSLSITAKNATDVEILAVFLISSVLISYIAERMHRVQAETRQKDILMIQQSRQAAMGEMINNIAHQWRQPLNTLGLHIQILPMAYERGELDKEFLDKSVNEAMLQIQYMSETIDDFREFFKPDKEKVEFRVCKTIANTMQLTEASFDDNRIKIVMNCMDDPVILGYPNEYSQVVLNILCNAKDALVANKTENRQVVISSSMENGKSVVTISDNAGGIPDKMISKVFDPFFSTKGTQGTGIGLFMAKNIIEKRMNGRLSVCNSKEGAEFRIEV